MTGLIDAVETALAEVGSLDARFLVPALLLQLSNLLLRSVAWRNVLAAAYPTRRVGLGSIAGAYAAGVGLNSFTPARGGDLVKVLLARARVHGSTVTAVGASLALVTALDAVVGASFVAALWALGVLPALPGPPGASAAAIVGVLGVLATGGILAWRRPELLQRQLTHAREGMAILRTPRRLARTVVPFQLAAWSCRVTVVLLVLAAFGITPGLLTAALIVVLNGAATIVPVPGGMGAQQVLAAYALHGYVSVAGALSFSVVLQVGITTVNVTVGLIALMLLFRSFRPLQAARSGLALARADRS